MWKHCCEHNNNVCPSNTSNGSLIPPHFVNERLARCFLFLFLLRIPCPHTEKSRHVHLVDLPHPPPGFQQHIVGAVYIIRQRQGAIASFDICSAISVASCVTGFVGKDSNTSVVCV